MLKLGTMSHLISGVEHPQIGVRKERSYGTTEVGAVFLQSSVLLYSTVLLASEERGARPRTSYCTVPGYRG